MDSVKRSDLHNIISSELFYIYMNGIPMHYFTLCIFKDVYNIVVLVVSEKQM